MVTEHCQVLATFKQRALLTKLESFASLLGLERDWSVRDNSFGGTELRVFFARLLHTMSINQSFVGGLTIKIRSIMFLLSVS